MGLRDAACSCIMLYVFAERYDGAKDGTAPSLAAPSLDGRTYGSALSSDVSPAPTATEGSNDQQSVGRHPTASSQVPVHDDDDDVVLRHFLGMSVKDLRQTNLRNLFRFKYVSNCAGVRRCKRQ